MNGQDQAFAHALALLPCSCRTAVASFSDTASIEEIRLRTGRQPAITRMGSEYLLPAAPFVTNVVLRQVLEAATRSSLHAAAESLKRGYLTARGGCRVGVCGTAAVVGGEIVSLREISSLSIRVAREQPDCALPILDRLFSDGQFQSTLVISPPGIGKTTLLRDLIRQLSLRDIRVGVVDERGELAAVSDGTPGFDLGPHTDILTGAPKLQGVMMLLRTMTPQVLALDEISEIHDAQAVEAAANNGAAIAATVHGITPKDVITRPIFRGLIERRIFHRMVTISLYKGKRVLRIEELGCS